MPFKLVKAQDITFERRIDVKIPTESNRIRSESFIGIFTALSSEEGDKLSKEGMSDQDLVRKVMIGWKEVVDPDTGEPVPFSPEALDLLLLLPAAMSTAPIAKAYLEAIKGQKYVSGN